MLQQTGHAITALETLRLLPREPSAERGRYASTQHSKKEPRVNEAPKRICIGHDDYYAKLVGRTRDGRQFFVTQPFVPYGHDFVARYLFDGDGQFLSATIHDLGKRSTGEPPGNALFSNTYAESLQQQLINELGEVEFCICVAE